jgi:hypothetical protein
MATERPSMRQIREILRQKWALGLSLRALASSLRVGLGTISSVVSRGRAAGLARTPTTSGQARMASAAIASYRRPSRERTESPSVRSPAVCSRIFAAILNFSTPLFNPISAVGPRAGACLLGRAGLVSKFDQVHGTILKRLESVRPGDWALANCVANGIVRRPSFGSYSATALPTTASRIRQEWWDVSPHRARPTACGRIVS